MANKLTLVGKHVKFFDDSRKATLEELRAHLARFNLTWTLRRIAEVGAVALESALELPEISAPAYCLPYLALVALQVCSDDGGDDPGYSPHLVEAIRLFNGLEEPLESTGSEWDGYDFLIRTAYAQLPAHYDLHNSTARTWLLYNDIWPTVAKAQGVAASTRLSELTGVSLPQLIMFGYAYTGRSKSGYFVPYTEQQLATLKPELGVGPVQQQRFLDWVTTSYVDARVNAAQASPGIGYDKYRLSPFLTKPVARPERPPAGAPDGLHLVPVPAFLARRVTEGLYHELANDSNAGGAINPFRTAFGHVFEAYVGELLRAGCGTASVIPEFKYGRKGTQVASPDWLVLDGSRLVVIEVKQSALTLNSKIFGRIADVVRDLRQNLAAGAEQVLNFRKALKLGTQGLEALSHVTEIELLVVTYDQIPFANFVFRGLMKSEGLADAEDVHFCSIDDFERLQQYSWRCSPFGHLRSKHDNSFNQSHTLDFRDWLSELGPPSGAHPLLGGVFKNIADTWGATLPGS